MKFCRDKTFPSVEGWHFAQQNDGVVFYVHDHPAAARHPSTGGELFEWHVAARRLMGYLTTFNP
jgi:hypothetical protein